MLLAGRGVLDQSQTGDGDVKVAVNAFSGYAIVVNTDIESEIEMGPL